MNTAALRKSPLTVGARAVLGALFLLAAGGAAHGATADAAGVSAASGRQLWRISDYTTVELVAREPGAAPNQQPWQVEPNTLHALLQKVQVVRAGAGKPLFAIDELNALVSALTEALAHARPDQDVALISAARHEDNTFYGLTAVTARLFVADGQLNLIVRDARYDFYDKARGTGVAPHFTVGSRDTQGVSTIQSPTALSKRADWLVLTDAAEPVAAASATVAGAAVPAVAPLAAVPAPVAVAAPRAAPAAVVAAAPLAAPAQVAAVPAPTPAPVAPVADAEQRLVTLKRLFDKGLITKPEYDKKRQEILKGL